MEEMSGTAWLHQGSSVVFDQLTLGRLIADGYLMSLRQALGWMGDWSAAPPGDAPTVLVSGLETCLEVLPPSDAEQFLRCRIKPFIYEFQRHWGQRGLVFGVGVTGKAFRTTMADEEILFVRPDRTRVRLSRFLWDGSSSLNVARLLREDGETRKPITVGYHVQRIS